MTSANPETRHSWVVEHWELSERETDSVRFAPKQFLELRQRGESLLDDEARIVPGIVEGKAGFIVLVREGNSLWVGSRPLIHPQENLEELAQVYSVLARGSDATVITDVTGALLAASTPWRRIYGYSLGELIGQNPRVINSRRHAPSFFQKMWHHLTDPRIGTWSERLTNRRRNGELVEVWQTITTVRGANHSIQGYLGQTRDMTEHHAAQDQLRRRNDQLLQLTRFKGEMMEIMAHDLKSPLQGIIGYAGLIREQGNAGTNATPPNVVKYAGRLEDLGRSMLGLVQNFLEIQRREVGALTIERRRANLRRLLRSVAACHSLDHQSQRVEVVLEESGDARPAFIDPIRIDQAIHNIVANAVRFTPEGERVTIRLTSQPGAPERIEVEDRGPGIAPDLIDQIFDPYFQAKERKEQGSIGLGLAIAHKVVELHGGRIWAENRPQGGCRFTVELPYGYTECYGKKLWSAVLFDPRQAWARALSERLEAAGIESFLATNAVDFLSLSQHELPSMLVFDTAHPPTQIPVLTDPGSGRKLTPVTVELSSDSHGTEIRAHRFDGPAEVIALAREQFTTQSAAMELSQ